MKVLFLREGAILPERATSGSVGYDLCACLEKTLELLPGESRPVPTGIAIDLEGLQAGVFLFARSGLATKHGICLSNGVGVVDMDYRGEILVALHNQSSQPFSIHPGDRIAQMVVLPVLLPPIEPAEFLSQTQRGQGGFGSTGISNKEGTIQ